MIHPIAGLAADMAAARNRVALCRRILINGPALTARDYLILTDYAQEAERRLAALSAPPVYA